MSGRPYLRKRAPTLGNGLNEDTQVSLLLVECLGTLPQTPGETIVNKSVLDDLLEGILDGHGTGLVGGGGLGGYLDIGGRCVGSGFRSSVRHFVYIAFFRCFL
jgi:hypothetical protein